MIVRPTIRGEAHQVHPDSAKLCNCHDIIKWIGRGYVVGEGVEIDDGLADPLDWVVKIGDEVRIVKAEDFPSQYEEMQGEDYV